MKSPPQFQTGGSAIGVHERDLFDARAAAQILV